MNSDDNRGRPEKPHVAKHLLLAKQIVLDAEAVRDKEGRETFTAMVETALVRETKHRLRRRKRQPSD